MRRTIRPNDPSIFDYQNHVERLSTKTTALDGLNQIIDWEAFIPLINKAFKTQLKQKGGRPAYDAIVMFKILVLQRIHNLSEEATELAIAERLTWHRFLGLHVGSRFPDKNTIWSFKQSLIQADCMSLCYDAFFEQLEKHGYHLESGKIVDASIVKVPVQHNTPKENATIKSGKTPTKWKGQKHKLCQKDCDASWTKKHNKSYFGYKNHIKVDQKTKFIENCVVTAAHVHDSQVLFDLIDKSDGRLYADSAYHSAAIKKRLHEMGIQDFTIAGGRRNTPLTHQQQRTNTTKSKIRTRVEHIFGTVTTSFAGAQQRCIGFKRNASMIIFTNLVYNMTRLRFLERA